MDGTSLNAPAPGQDTACGPSVGNRKPGKWITCPSPNPSATLRLFCLPFAGGGASVFRGWDKALPGHVELCPIQLPGRENRLADPPFTAVAPLVERLAVEIAPWLDKPFAFFGHSLGALLSFELTRHLRRQGSPLPRMLILSAHRAAHLPIRRPRLIGLTDEQFLEGIRSFGGTPKEVFDIPDLVGLILPTLRADFMVCDGYSYTEDDPLPCPFVLYAGRQDLEVSPQEVEAWSQHSTGGTRLRIFPGDHFFLRSDRDLLLRAMASVLA